MRVCQNIPPYYVIHFWLLLGISNLKWYKPHPHTRILAHWKTPIVHSPEELHYACLYDAKIRKINLLPIRYKILSRIITRRYFLFSYNFVESFICFSLRCFWSILAPFLVCACVFFWTISFVVVAVYCVLVIMMVWRETESTKRNANTWVKEKDVWIAEQGNNTKSWPR